MWILDTYQIWSCSVCLRGVEQGCQGSLHSNGWQESQWSYQKWESIGNRWSIGRKINISNETRLVLLTVKCQQDCACETAEMQNRRTGKVVLQVAIYKECRKASIRCLRLTLHDTGWSYPFSLWVFHFCSRVRIFPQFVLIMMPTWSKLMTKYAGKSDSR